MKNLHGKSELTIFSSRHLRFAAVALAAVFLLCSCAADDIATVNGEKIPLAKYRKLKERRIEAHKASGIEYKENEVGRALLDEMISKTLIKQASRERNVVVNEAMVKARFDAVKGNETEEEFLRSLKSKGISPDQVLSDIEDQLLFEEFRKTFGDIADVSLDDVRKAYESGEKPVKAPARVKLRMIITYSLDEALKIYDELEKRPFEKVADELEKNKTAKVGKPEWLSLDSVSPDLANALMSVKAGGYTRPMIERGGWASIAKIYEKQDPVYATFEEAKQRIMLSMIEKKRTKLFNEWLATARQNADIKIRDKYIRG